MESGQEAFAVVQEREEGSLNEGRGVVMERKRRTGGPSRWDTVSDCKRLKGKRKQEGSSVSNRRGQVLLLPRWRSGWTKGTSGA